MADIIAALNAHEEERLKHCESIIKRGINTFVTTGIALAEINEGRLYRGTHGTFEVYVRERFNTSREHAYRLMRAAAISRTIGDDVTHGPQPENERQTRPLAGLTEPQAKEAWNDAVKASGGAQPTTAQVKEAAAKVKGEKPKQVLKSLHSYESVEWYTPGFVVDAARATLGGTIDLDPASNKLANKTIKAKRFIGPPKDGLAVEWAGRVWCNPPYGKTAGESNQGLWLTKAFEEVESERVDAAVLLLAASIGRKWFRPVWEQAACFFYERINFIDENGKKGMAPTIGNVAVLIARDSSFDGTFAKAFEKLGRVVFP